MEKGVRLCKEDYPIPISFRLIDDQGLPLTVISAFPNSNLKHCFHSVFSLELRPRGHETLPTRHRPNRLCIRLLVNRLLCHQSCCCYILSSYQSLFFLLSFPPPPFRSRLILLIFPSVYEFFPLKRRRRSKYTQNMEFSGIKRGFSRNVFNFQSFSLSFHSLCDCYSFPLKTTR